jgi:hypothetical protein
LESNYNEQANRYPLPGAFKHIRLELARSKEFPQGSPTHGYEFVAPLDADGHIDATLWHEHRDHCRVRRFWGDEEEIGFLVRSFPWVGDCRRGYVLLSAEGPECF